MDAILLISVLILSIVVHEVAHAWQALSRACHVAFLQQDLQRHQEIEICTYQLPGNHVFA